MQWCFKFEEKKIISCYLLLSNYVILLKVLYILKDKSEPRIVKNLCRRWLKSIGAFQ